MEKNIFVSTNYGGIIMDRYNEEKIEHGINQKMEKLSEKVESVSKELSASEEEQAGMEELLKKLSE